jgi:hypothetical protein
MLVFDIHDRRAWAATAPIAPGRFVSIGLIVLGTACQQAPNDVGKDTATKVSASALAPAEVEIERDLVDNLVGAGWTHGAARAVVRLNADWFRRLSRDAPDDLKRQRVLLRQLGRYPQVLDVIERHPETAGLLAQADDPTPLADSLRDERHYDVLSSLYVRHVAPEDAEALARAWTRHGNLIARLNGRGLGGAELLFMGAEEDPGDREYERWLDDYCMEYLDRPDEELVAAIVLALIHGPTLRHRFEEDGEFRRTFRDELWPRYTRVVTVARLGPETFVWAPEIWDLLRLPEGEELVRRWGLLPIDLLFSPQGAYPDDLQPELIQILLHGDNTKIRALYDFRTEPLFHRILRRHGLSEATRLAFLDRLMSEGPEILKRFDQYSDQAFTEELGPPASGVVTWLPLYYTVYEVPKKVIQGRPVPWVEIVQAATDPIFLCLPGSKGAEGAAGGAIKTTLVGRARQLAVKQIGIQTAERLSEKELAPWLLTEILTQTQRSMAKWLAERSTVEITGPVRLLYETSGVGRASFRRLTGLEARLFMRGDARVFVRLDRLLADSVARSFLDETAQAARVGALVESPPGQEAIQGAMSIVRGSGNDFLETYKTWQEHASAWWLMNASGMVSRAGHLPQPEPNEPDER